MAGQHDQARRLFRHAGHPEQQRCVTDLFSQGERRKVGMKRMRVQRGRHCLFDVRIDRLHDPLHQTRRQGSGRHDPPGHKAQGFCGCKRRTQPVLGSTQQTPCVLVQRFGPDQRVDIVAGNGRFGDIVLWRQQHRQQALPASAVMPMTTSKKASNNRETPIMIPAAAALMPNTSV